MPFRQGTRMSLIMLSWVPVVMTVSQTVANVTWIQGGSMKPALNPDESFGWRDMVLMWKYGQRSQGVIQVGDIVMVRSPLEPEKILVKRVVGVGGDEIITKPSYPKRTCKVPSNHIWIEGDNSSQSIDSNTFGPVSLGLLLGKATKIIFPPSRFGPVNTKGGREARLEYLKDKEQ
jgi:mitochondrial inner membrane protease subunit 2